MCSGEDPQHQPPALYTAGRTLLLLRVHVPLGHAAQRHSVQCEDSTGQGHGEWGSTGNWKSGVIKALGGSMLNLCAFLVTQFSIHTYARWIFDLDTVGATGGHPANVTAARFYVSG